MDRLFAYGTLMPGRLRWPLISALVASHHQATVPGTLFDAGHGYPAATFAAGTLVHGAVLVLRSEAVEQAWALLDRIEGTAYERITVTSTDGEEVTTYAWIADVAGLVEIPDGRWPAAREH